MSDQISQFFTALDQFLIKEIAPIREQLDQDHVLLQKAYEGLVALGGLKLLIPKHCGGMGGDHSEWVRYNILLAQYSGVLLFLQAQHQYSVSKLKQLMPGQSIERCLIEMVETNQGTGIFGAPFGTMILGKRVAGGYQISGSLPWVTGYQYFNQYLTPFCVEDTLYYIQLPFRNIETDLGKITISDTVETIVFNAAHTVKVLIEDLFVPDDQIIASIESSKNTPLEHPSAFNFAGVSLALLDIAKKGYYFNNLHAQERHAQLSEQLARYCDELKNTTEFPKQRRASGRHLAEQCAFFSRSVWGAQSMLLHHPVNRLSMEIWQYTVAGYGDEQLEAYLACS